ncbi:MAG: glycosyltransferase family 39 protein [Proteobacteria bacterium]|nr:glycosyltransferase family 39 protein [Pseudomonadota bacterium]
MQQTNPQADNSAVIKLFAIGFCSVLLIKVFLALVLDLYSDEVFYWQASARPALAYSDLPFMTALLIGIGSSLNPGSAIAARLVFILLGACLPLLMYWIARPLTNQRQALETAALTLCLPLGGFLGLLAVPDVPLLFFGLLSIGCFERALRTERLKYWMATGIFVACGLSTHYRFFLYPAAVIVFLIWFAPQRRQWRNPGLWLAMAIASIGLLPIIWFNLGNQLSSASFYFIDRHPWEFQASGLLHLFKQAALVTPPLYAAMVITLWQLHLRARNGDASAALFMTLALMNILVYLILAPWTDATSTSIHWPLSGYFPLLVFVPATLRQAHGWFRVQWNSRVADIAVTSVPVIGFTGTLIALLGVGSQAYQQPLQALLGTGVLSNKMAGWKQFTDYTAVMIDAEFEGDSPVIITDNYYTAAQTEFSGLATGAFTLDQDKAVRDGRISQYQLWRLDASGLAAEAGKSALFITEDSTLTIPDKHDVLGRVCQLGDTLKYLGELSLFNGDKRFSYYKVDRLLDTSAEADYRAYPCPFPARAWIDFPPAKAEISGLINVSGWAYNEDIGVDEIRLILDGQRVGTARYGVSRSDVVEAMNVMTDPNAPNLGFELELDSRNWTNGSHEFAIEILNQQGITLRYGDRIVTVSN